MMEADAGATVFLGFGVPSVVGGPAAVAKTPPICSWLPAHLLPSHLIQQQPSPASFSCLKSLWLQDFRLQDPTPAPLGRETAAADHHRGKPVLFQARDLEPVVGVCPHPAPSRCPCQEGASPRGAEASALISRALSLQGRLQPSASPPSGSIFNEGDEFPPSSHGWPPFESLPLKCVRRREALHHV